MTKYDERMQIEHQITYLGKFIENKWEHYAWRVQIGCEVFDYKTGTGHASKTPPKDRKFKTIDFQEYVFIPKIEDVLQSLLIDESCGAESFFDFCANFGYDTDSRKALDVYLACQESGEKLRRALGPKYSEVKTYIERLEL